MGTIQKGLGTVGDFFGNIQKIRDGFKDIADSKFGGWIGNVVDRFKQFEFPKDFKEILREIPRMVFPEDLFGDLTLIEGLDFSKLKEAFDIGKFDGFKTGVSKMLTELDGQFANMGKSVKTAFAEMGKSTNPLVMAIGRLGTLIMANPIIAAIAAIVAIMVILYNTSDEFRKFVDDALKRVMGYLTRAWEQLQEAFQPVIDAWNRLMAAFGVGQGGSNPLVMFFEALVKILEVLLSVLIPIITTIVTMFIPQITFLIDLVASWVKIFRGLYDIVTAFFTALFTWNWDKFGEVAGKAFKDIGNAALGLFNGIANFFVDMINNIIKGINDISTNIKDASGGTINFGKIPTLPHVNLHLAKGGVVMPSPGGSLVNVAEAGKPEKVVPLDSEGLSAGDRKVLDALNSRSGINIAINGADMDKNELAAEVSRRLAFQMRKGAI
jgi:phage-related protein